MPKVINEVPNINNGTIETKNNSAPGSSDTYTFISIATGNKVTIREPKVSDILKAKAWMFSDVDYSSNEWLGVKICQLCLIEYGSLDLSKSKPSVDELMNDLKLEHMMEGIKQYLGALKFFRTMDVLGSQLQDD